MARRLLKAADNEFQPVKSMVRQVRQWEAGRHFPRAWADAYAAAFGASVDELFDGTRRRPANSDAEERMAAAVARPLRIDATVVESLATILAANRRQEDLIGPSLLIGPVGAQFAALEHLVTEARGPARPAVVGMAAQWAQFSAWLHIATGHLTAVRGLLDRTSEWAVEAGDLQLVGSAMSWRGFLAEHLGQYPAIVGVAKAGQRYRSRAGVVYDLYLEAQGHAFMGEVREAEQALGKAETCASDLGEDDARPWEYYYLAPGFFDLEHGRTLRRMARTDGRFNAAAAERIDSGLAALPDDMRDADWTAPYREARAAAQRLT